MDRFLSIRLKDPQPPSFMIHLLGFPEVPYLFSWSASFQVICLFSTSWVADGTYMLSFFLFMGMLPWAVSITAGLLLHIPRIPGFWQSPSILVQLSLWVPPQSSLLRAGLSFFFSLFHKAQSLPIHGFGPFLTYLVVLNWQI